MKRSFSIAIAFPHDGRLPSLRDKLIILCATTSILGLLISVSILLLLIGGVMGNFVHNEVEFAMKATCDGLSVKTTLAEDMLLDIRKNATLTNALLDDGLQPEQAGESGTADELKRVISIYSDKNIVAPGLPFIEMVYLFDREGRYNCAVYHENLTSTQRALDLAYSRLFQRFSQSGQDVSISASGTFLNIAITVYNEWTEPLGTAIFAINRSAIETLMEKTGEYESAMWALFAKDGAVLLQSSGVSLTETERQTLSQTRSASGYALTVEKTEYLAYTEFLNMGMRCAVAVPSNQLSRLLYGAVVPYLFPAILLLVATGLFLFFFIMRLTKPFPEITAHLERVAKQEFDVKLPAYDTYEFNTVSTAFNTMTDTIRHLISDVYEKRLIAMDSEIRLLQSQINPHFMFNVLSTIALTAKLNGDEEVFTMTSNFAGLTQARLSTGGENKIPLAQELRFVRFYLELQKVRFGEKLSYEILVESPELETYIIPRLTVEMIVENAVAHGIEPKDGAGHVSICLNHSPGGIRILVEDDGVGFQNTNGFVTLPLQMATSASSQHNYIALNTAYRLLKHFYGDAYGISIFSQTGAGTTVTIEIPKEVEPNT